LNKLSQFKITLSKVLFGGGKNLQDPEIFHKISLTAFLAWVGIGADGLSSSCYGPPEAFLHLGSHYYLSIFVALATGLTVIIISISYSQIIELFPTGGGGYLVASKLLSPRVGMISGSALLIDYVLTIAISVASGSDAFFSFLPIHFQAYKLYFAIIGVFLLIILNIRGVKESVLPLVPIFLVFLLTHVFMILYAVISNLFNFSELATSTYTEINNTSSELGMIGMLIIITKAYTMGAGTYTGIEAVSNGVPLLREPKVATAKKTMKLMAISLSFMVMGLLISYLLYKILPQQGKTLNAVLFSTITSDWGQLGYYFVIIILFSEAFILFVAAQAGFIDGPRVLANMANDRWLPTKFSILSDRLVAQNGVLLMGGAALLTMILTKGNVAILVVLYSINVFITFFLSQLGMVKHWWQVKKESKRWKHKIFINGLGLILTTLILVSVITIKFFEGGWVTILLTGSLILFSFSIKRHYNKTYMLLKELDDQILPAITASINELSNQKKEKLEFNLRAKTAVIFVNGFNGLGVHTLLAVIKTFPNVFKNFVFAEVGVLDTGTFKGSEAIDNLQEKVQKETNKYVEFVTRFNLYGKAFHLVDTEIVQGALKISEEISNQFPNSVFFGGQIVFPNETFFSRLLHNQIVFSIQRRLYHKGFPFVILPIRIQSF
jgi:amino acid transporter